MAPQTQLDTFMDVLNEGDGVDVHRLVQGIVTKPGSQPNANHSALARIAAKYSTRVVTTNYDLHLETALRAHHADSLDVFRAPAMPLGDDFDGLVYLHGYAEDDPRRLVVTDRDFSSAYFHSAWAVRFLERMFREYVVLFVGYSHSDVVMKYLGLGLGPESKRYVLTDDPGNAIWRRLQVTALEYPAGRHDLLTGCLVEWSKFGEMGLLDHRQRLRELLSTASEPTPDEESYLEDSLRRDDRVRFFCEFATDKYWLEWAAKREPFRKLFDRSTGSDPVTIELAEWFAHSFALVDDAAPEPDELRSLSAWTVFAEAGGVLSAPVWNALGSGLLGMKTARSAHAVRWLWVLMEQEQAGCEEDFLDYAIEWTELEEDPELFVELLAHLMAPRLVPERGWGSARMGVKTRGRLHWIDKSWKKLQPAIAALAPTVFPVVEAALLKHLDLEARVGSPRGFNRHRSAIQQHAQDKHRDPIDAVIDAARDTAVALWNTDAAYVWRLIERWLISNHVLMRRIAVHVCGEQPGLSGDEGVRFILERDLATADGIAQEVLHLLGKAAPTADPSLVDQLVDAWKPASDDEDDQYRAFSRLEWLERNNVDNEQLRTTLADIRTKLPADLKGSPYPGMSSWMEVGSGDGVQPLTVEAFNERIEENPEEAVQFVLSFEERPFPRSGETSREDAVTMLRDTVQERAGAGLKLWPYLTDHPGLQDTVIAAWGHAKASDDAEAIMAILADLDLEPVLHGVTQFFMYADRNGGARWETMATTERFMTHVWDDACATADLYEPGGGQRDWSTKIINVPAGLLLEFWFEMFRRRWAAAGDDWQGLSETDRAFLERALADRTERGAMALTQMAGRLHLVDAADSSWCRTNLLPLGNWADERTAEPFWWGVLSFARWNSGLVAAGLLDSLLGTAKHLNRFQEDQAHRWASLLASIAVQCDDPAATSWVREMTARSDASSRLHWLDAIEEIMKELDEPGRVAVWSGWLAEYWRRRTLSDPVALSQPEANALAALAPHVPAADFNGAVALVEATSAGFNSHADSAECVSDGLIETQSAEVGRYFIHLMSNTDASPGQFWGRHYLAPKLKHLVAQPGDWKALRDAALRLRIDLSN
ncbi:SIR2 family protein [Kribbella sp. DT2]|uniref:SIR2 family protein n=1 Tax=Kribbella sp. DT2 TaxID=3393427 RepID=UPI003CF754A0